MKEERDGKGTGSEYDKKPAYGDRDNIGATEAEKVKEREKEVFRVVYIYMHIHKPCHLVKTCVRLTIPEANVPFTELMLQAEAATAHPDPAP